MRNSINRLHLTIAAIAFFLLVIAPCAKAALPADQNALPVLDAAESCFKAMKTKDFGAIWQSLSTKSRNTIAEDVRKNIPQADRDRYPIDAIQKDFALPGPLAQSYWKAFIENFNPDTVLEESEWRMGSFQKDKAEIVIQYKKAERPAMLKMFKEGGQWKVGLVETFWARK